MQKNLHIQFRLWQLSKSNSSFVKRETGTGIQDMLLFPFVCVRFRLPTWSLALGTLASAVGTMSANARTAVQSVLLL